MISYVIMVTMNDVGDCPTMPPSIPRLYEEIVCVYPDSSTTRGAIMQVGDPLTRTGHTCMMSSVRAARAGGRGEFNGASRTPRWMTALDTSPLYRLASSYLVTALSLSRLVKSGTVRCLTFRLPVTPSRAEQALTPRSMCRAMRIVDAFGSFISMWHGGLFWRIRMP